MKVFKKLLLLVAAAPLFLGSCVMNNGLCYTHVDANKDGICDVCGSAVKSDKGSSTDDPNKEVIPGNPCVVHVDYNLDGTCDNCGASMSSPEHDHIDGNQDGKCDICNATMIICNHHDDSNGDGKCDNCGATMPLPQGDVTVYLVLSSVGLYNNKKGDDIPSLNLENTVALVLAVGSDLPGKDVITHSYKSATFDHWACYEGSGAPTVYTKVPAANNKILYAQFVPNGQTPVTPTPTPDPEIPVDTKTRTFTLKTNFEGGNWSQDNAKIQVYCWSSGGKNLYTCSKVDDNTFTFTIGASYTGCLFLRMHQDTVFNLQTWDKSVIWNQSADLAIDTSKDVEETATAQIQGWSNDAGKSPVAWVA